MVLRLLVMLFLLLAAPALAAESPAVRSARATAALVTDTDAVSAGTPFRAALRLQLAPGWHVYWRNPGQAGQATEMVPIPPSGATTAPVEWPAPTPLTEADITVYGYTGTVLLPFTVTPGPQGGDTFRVSATASWLVCQAVCVPEEGQFDIALPWGSPAPSTQAPAFTAALARVPAPAPFEATLSPSGVLTLSGPDLAGARTARFIPDDPDTIADGAAQDAAATNDGLRLRLTPGPAFKPGAVHGVVLLDDPQRAFTVAPRTVSDPVSTSLSGLLLAGFAGGLLLNLMPCVFPVLAMKAAALARLGGAGRRAVRWEALAYTAGVLVTFCALGGGLALAGGGGGGWGSQFQSPAFVAGAAWLLFAVGLNLSGVWTAGTALMNIGAGPASRGGMAGSFLTGALAVAVAAPCTAPFMGTAVAAAFALPALAGLAVFAAMGAGLAAPYAILAVWPGLAAWLPRPGRWMEVLKGALAFPMYATVAWLVWVVDTEAGTTGVLVVASGLVLVGFAAWTWSVASGARAWAGRVAGRALAGLAVAAAVALLPTAEAGPAATTAEPFTAARLADLRAAGRPVFVDMTASWCIPCLVNERIALSPEPVRQAFAERDVVLLRGDWTRKDPAITAFLRSHDRAGVPLYVFYPPGGAPVVLPQLLTPGLVLAQLEGARPGS